MDDIRLDLWLWFARFFKTRSLAVAAIDGGKIEVNGEKPKRAKAIRPGDRLRIRLGPYEHRITVLEVARRRGSAAQAATLYEEDPDSRAARERVHEMHRLAREMGGDPQKGRPTKRDRREIERWRNRD